MSINRRQFLKLMGLAGLAPFAPGRLLAQQGQIYNGPFFISIAAIGGWDVTSFCDPKTNIGGERTINNWASGNGIGSAGNIKFAPVADNRAFFERYYRDMLVINGIDTQTNSHDDGVRHTWSGRIGVGYPSFGAVASAAIDPQLPLSLVHAAGYSETAGITRFSRLQSPDVIRNLVNQSQVAVGSNTYTLYSDADLARIDQFQNARLARLIADESVLPRQQAGLNALYLANSSREQLELFSDLLPAQFETNNDFKAAEMALLAYQSGLSVACQLGISGFDTHQDHDTLHYPVLSRLTSLVNYLYNKAEAGGFAGRLVITMSSDFGRRPFYNSGAGKDHWPIGSALIIMKDAPWGNRVVGKTDGLHNALKINPQTLQQSDSGVILEPKHLHLAMRRLAGIEQSEVASLFPLNAENVDFFNPSLQTS